MRALLYVAAFVVILLLSSFNEKYLDFSSDRANAADSFLFKDDTLFKRTLPFIWIPVEHVPNARRWLSWGGRSTKMVNQPYLNLSVKTVIDKCGESFNVALIDDSTFAQLLPNWDIDLCKVAEPHRSTLRTLALTKVLYNHGGIVVPPSFVCMKNLKDMYYRQTMNGRCVFGECRNHSYSYPDDFSLINMQIMGCEKKCYRMLEIVKQLEGLASTDYTDQVSFLGEVGRIAQKAVDEGNANKIEAEFLGVRDKDGNAITLEQLMGDDPIELHERTLGVMLPNKEILDSIKYGWFVRMDIDQVLKSKTNIGRFLLTGNCS